MRLTIAINLPDSPTDADIEHAAGSAKSAVFSVPELLRAPAERIFDDIHGPDGNRKYGYLMIDR